jgi:malonyl CoA-acyl carrier protein transacylase
LRCSRVAATRVAPPIYHLLVSPPPNNCTCFTSTERPSGPKEKLDDTIYAQPALLVANLAAAEQLRARNPAAAAACGAAAGLSLGEYAALVWAGALTIEDALKASYFMYCQP